MITAEIKLDSVSPAGRRLTTFILKYPRFIHSELMTHRVFSRNAASSRAIPFARMVALIEEQPAGPVYWGSNKPGMQSGAELGFEDRAAAADIWQGALRLAMRSAGKLDAIGVHKSISNRLLEPFAHMTTLVSATEWSNFFHLRAHADAQPEFRVLAFLMLEAYLHSEPAERDTHRPFGEEAPEGREYEVATARCARLSYLTFDGEHAPEKDVALHDGLVKAGHWSPFEHCADALEDPDKWSGNFRGWLQYRKCFGAENATGEDLAAIYQREREALSHYSMHRNNNG
jgi:hypothetical protein